MPNILFDNTCNLKCPYCFSDITREEDKQWLTKDNLIKILDWMEDTSYIGVIGGEPTLHPQFNELLKTIYEYQSRGILTNTLLGDVSMPRTTVFTNGILLGEWLERDPSILELPNIVYLINYNQLKPELNNKIRHSLQIMYDCGLIDRIGLGCNLYDHDDDNYQWYWDTVEEFNITKIRVSVVSPANLFSKWRNDRFTYFEKMKPHFIKFMENVKRHHLALELIDCGYIPMCMFNQDEYKLVNQFVFRTDRICYPIIDIYPDLQCISCFGSCSIAQPLSKFKNMQDAIDFFTPIAEEKRKLNLNNPRCINCEEALNNRCQAGCLCFAGME